MGDATDHFQEKTTDKINHPSHYHAAGGHEAIDVIESWGLGFCLGNAVKYICRAGLKPGVNVLEDLRKAVWYIERYINTEEKKQAEMNAAVMKMAAEYAPGLADNRELALKNLNTYVAQRKTKR
jgi:hypothetical protein